MKKFLRTILLADLLKGLWVTFRNQKPSLVYTEQYPKERPAVAERYRGAPRLNVHPDSNETLCIACNLCALACPELLVIVGAERNPETRRKELTHFTYDLSRCMFCGLCEDACPVDALELRIGLLHARRRHLGSPNAGGRSPTGSIQILKWSRPLGSRRRRGSW